MKLVALSVAAASSFLFACAGDGADPLPSKDDFRSGKTDEVLPTCEEHGFPAGCDLCAELGWYGDGECDDDLVAAGVCAMADEADCTPTAFRVTAAKLADPHVYVSFGICADVTGVLDDKLSDQIAEDGDGDGDLDLTLLNIFRPLAPANAATEVEVALGGCAGPAPGHDCTSDPTAGAVTAAVQQSSGECLGAIPGTVPSGSGVATATAPCYATDPIDLPLSLAGVDLQLEDARVGGTFAGDAPATAIQNGLARGFVSEAQANALILPDDLPVVGGKPLSKILPGGQGSCKSTDGRDLGPDGVTKGWYFYINFSGEVVTLAPR
ncbi:MAG TPA: hypothetical protein VMZ28_20740 [Kofleriaceae bacterium]|nr:hypothetical protein [Kofleriaceae bacterium]